MKQKRSIVSHLDEVSVPEGHGTVIKADVVHLEDGVGGGEDAFGCSLMYSGILDADARTDG